MVFLRLTALFFLLAAGCFTGIILITGIGGWVGIFCGASAIYFGLAQVINEVYGKIRLPV